MQLHTLSKYHESRGKQRRGRGGKRGSFSGRGIKGQKARAGRRIRPEMRDLIMKMPKRRGHSHSVRPIARVALSIPSIVKKFKQGERITPKELYNRGLVRRVGGKIPKIRLVGPKEALRNYTVQGCTLSKTQ